MDQEITSTSTPVLSTTAYTALKGPVIKISQATQASFGSRQADGTSSKAAYIDEETNYSPFESDDNSHSQEIEVDLLTSLWFFRWVKVLLILWRIKKFQFDGNSLAFFRLLQQTIPLIHHKRQWMLACRIKFQTKFVVLPSNHVPFFSIFFSLQIRSIFIFWVLYW